MFSNLKNQLSAEDLTDLKRRVIKATILSLINKLPNVSLINVLNFYPQLYDKYEKIKTENNQGLNILSYAVHTLTEYDYNLRAKEAQIILNIFLNKLYESNFISLEDAIKALENIPGFTAAYIKLTLKKYYEITTKDVIEAANSEISSEDLYRAFSFAKDHFKNNKESLIELTNAVNTRVSDESIEKIKNTTKELLEEIDARI